MYFIRSFKLSERSRKRLETSLASFDVSMSKPFLEVAQNSIIDKAKSIKILKIRSSKETRKWWNRLTNIEYKI
jgi:hypothetical protein